MTSRLARDIAAALVAYADQLDADAIPDAPVLPPEPPEPVVAVWSADTWAERLRADREDPHEGELAGVPWAYDWVKGPVRHWGHDPGGHRAVNSWMQVHGHAGRVPLASWLEVAEVGTYVLSGGQWRLLNYGRGFGVVGRPYRADFGGNTSGAPNELRSPEGNARVTVSADGAVIWHGWPVARAAIPGGAYDAVVSWCRFRLDPLAPNESDDLLVSCGHDWWRDMTAVITSAADVGKVNRGSGIGRAQLATAEWRICTFNTVTAEVLAAHGPPPIDTLSVAP